MQRRSRSYLISSLALALLLMSLVSANLVFAKSRTYSASHNASRSDSRITGSGRRISGHMRSMHTANMHNVSASPTKALQHIPAPALSMAGVSRAQYAKWKQEAAHNKSAPRGLNIRSAPLYNPRRSVFQTPVAIGSFQGMADSASICPHSNGCQPPDMAIAASPSWVLQGVNTSFAVYNRSGVLQSGWPKTSQSFFGVPNPGTCDPGGPYMSDPRAFYDPNDQRFWVAIFQAEGKGGNPCPFSTLYWIGVSQTSDPTGSWNLYSFDMTVGSGTTNYADYVQFGFDQQNIYFSANMFNQADTAFQYAEIEAISKAVLERGDPHVTFFGFDHLRVTADRTVLVDTVQPVEAETPASGGPSGGLFINSFDRFFGDPFNHDCVTNNDSGLCHGLAVWSISNAGTASESLSFAFVDTPNYVHPPKADQPGSTGSVDTLDTRISGTPVYHNGLISFALESNFNNGTQNVPGIMWGQVAPALAANGSLTGATLFQQGDLLYANDGAAYFGALMPDAAGDLFMVFEFSNKDINPEVAYISRRVTDPPGQLSDSGFVLRAGDAATGDTRWGDYEAASYDGPSTNIVWIAGEYSPSNGDWSTYIGALSY